MNAPDAIERLRERLATGDTVGLYVLRDDARAILDHITALTAERDAAVAEVGQIVAWLRSMEGRYAKMVMPHMIAGAIAAGAHVPTA
jgi:hypothetical protein